MSPTFSTAQKTFQRERSSLDRMPRMPGQAACSGDRRFDVLAEKDRISKSSQNELAQICATCPLRDCGWRQFRTD